MSTVDIIIALVVIFAFGWYLGAKVQFILDQITFRKILQDLGISNRQLLKLIELDELEEEPAAPVDELEALEVSLEVHQGVIYAYRKDNKQFLGQGVDQAALVTSISHRLKGVRLIIDQVDGSELLQKRNT